MSFLGMQYHFLSQNNSQPLQTIENKSDKEVIDGFIFKLKNDTNE
jgi:hypothetical protein